VFADVGQVGRGAHDPALVREQRDASSVHPHAGRRLDGEAHLAAQRAPQVLGQGQRVQKRNELANGPALRLSAGNARQPVHGRIPMKNVQSQVDDDERMLEAVGKAVEQCRVGRPGGWTGGWP
jgi:hypothetical protein